MEKPWLAHYEPGVPTEAEVPEWTVVQNLATAAQRYPRRAAITYGGLVDRLGGALLDGTMRYRTLLALTQRFAAALQSMGVKPGDRVALHLPNCPQFVIAWHAVLMIGSIAVPCNPHYVARELRHQLQDSEAETIVTLTRTVKLVQELRDSTSLKRVIATGLDEYYPWPLRLLQSFGAAGTQQPWCARPGAADVVPFRDVLARAPVTPTPATPAMDDTAVLMYTGGTTGVSKGAQLTHRNLQANIAQVQAWLRLTHERPQAILTSLPLFHSYGMTMCMNLAVAVAGAQVLIANPRALVHILKSIRRHRPALYPGVPATYVAINSFSQIGCFDISSIRACISGAAPLPVEVQQRFQSLTGGRLVEGYGLSEAAPVTHINPLGEGNRIGTIGLPVPGTDARIVDAEAGTCELASGEVGELIVRGPQVMKGYWRMPEETASVLRNGWLHTGDLARMDTDGYFQIVDRKKDLILSAGGLKVYPREVEEVLYQHPKVQSCAVIGVPGGVEKGEIVKAFVIMKEGEAASAEELIQFCRQHLSGYKLPRLVEFRDQLPMSAAGKVLRRVLLEEERLKAREA